MATSFRAASGAGCIARHEATTTSCRSRAEWRDRHAVAARYAAATEHEFIAYTSPLRRVEIFKYLWRLIAYGDADVPAARRQLSHARAMWGRLRKVIEK